MLITNTLSSPRYAAVLFGLLLTLCAAEVTAGSLDAPAAPTDPLSAMYTLQNLCDRLASGAAGMQRGGPFVEPTAGPAATMCTLNQIMAAMPTLNANGAVAADVLAGKTFWGLTSGGWGLKTGIATVGASIPFPAAKTGDATENGNNPRGATWPSPRFADNINGTVTDNLTGLVWLKDADCAGVKTWPAAMAWAAALADGQTCTNDNLSDGSVAGQWRLPNIKELSSLVDAGASSSPVLPGHLFTGVQSDYYWSSTTYPPFTSGAWVVGLHYGDVYAFDKTLTYYVWPVRGGL